MSRKKSWSRQELKELFAELDNTCIDLDYKYNINFGGCCYTSLCIAEELFKRHIKYSLVLFGEDIDDYTTKEIRSNIHNRINTFPTGTLTTSHYAIKLSHIGIINESDYKGEPYKTVSNITPKDIKFIYNNGSWNKSYKTFNNRKVRKIIIKVFEKYEKEHFVEV